MKIYLASFWENQYHGNGRMIAVCNNKPDNFKLSFAYKQFIPYEWISEGYDDLKKTSHDKASDYFNENYLNQLNQFKSDLVSYCQKSNLSPIDVLPFMDGDTLLSWERYGYSNYRGAIGKILKSIGYEVVVR